MKKVKQSEIISTFLKLVDAVQKEYDTAYQKVDKTKNRYVFDVGSHTEFFILDVGDKIVDELTGI